MLDKANLPQVSPKINKTAVCT